MIRPLKKSDFSSFIQLFITNTGNISESDFVKVYDISSRDAITFVYEENGITVGTAKILYEYKFTNNLCIMGHIEDVSVLPGYRKMGIASKLIHHIVDLCKKKNCYKITLNCSSELVHMYSTLGFHTKGFEMVQYYDSRLCF